ncbi:MAG: GNAT family N-acetyltransferase [Actinophytocola sp.]|uniref:GNAT family N-acetyltransferase n=1 Tax=Actinophytocola sp. TaxID=1872138 RepID=UPI003D6BF9D4
MRIRPGDVRDMPILFEFFDEAVPWLVARGSAGQWGSEPFSAQPRQVERITAMVSDGDLWLAESGGEPAGALIVNERPKSYAPPVDERELYVILLLVSRRHAGERVGSRLLDHAREQARARGIGLLRLDCYAGGDGDLVRYYLRNGFTPSRTVDLDGWPGQVFEQRL